MPAWSGLQSVAAVNIADAIAEALLAFLAERRDRRARSAPVSLRRAGEFADMGFRARTIRPPTRTPAARRSRR